MLKKMFKLFTLLSTYFFLHITCITNHSNMEAILLVDENSYRALIGIYDRRNSLLKPRNSVPNK